MTDVLDYISPQGKLQIAGGVRISYIATDTYFADSKLVRKVINHVILIISSVKNNVQSIIETGQDRPHKVSSGRSEYHRSGTFTQICNVYMLMGTYLCKISQIEVDVMARERLRGKKVCRCMTS